MLQAHQTAAFDCQLMAKRTPGASVLGADEAVGALRVSANGWEGFILEGFEPLLARPRAPPVVAVEWNPAAMRAAGYADPLAMVHRCAGRSGTGVCGCLGGRRPGPGSSLAGWLGARSCWCWLHRAQPFEPPFPYCL